MNLDEQLLAQKQEEGGRNAETAWGAYDSARNSAWADKASRLRKAQRSGGSDDSQTEPSAVSLREAVLAAKKKESAQAGGEGGDSGAASPIRQGSSKLLQQAWLNIITSWGCTLFWINIHAFFLNQLFGDKFFCKLGDEWKDSIPGGGAATAAGGVAGKVAGAVAEAKPPVKPSMEIWGLIGCDLGCLLILLAVASIIAIVVMIVSDPVAAAQIVGEVIVELFKKMVGAQ
jgi:hypothetical protein